MKRKRRRNKSIKWDVKAFDMHRKEWLKRPTMSPIEVETYLGIKEPVLHRLESLKWIGKVMFLHGNRWKMSYDRFEIIAFAHEIGLRT